MIRLKRLYARLQCQFHLIARFGVLSKSRRANLEVAWAGFYHYEGGLNWSIEVSACFMHLGSRNESSVSQLFDIGSGNPDSGIS